MFSDPRPDRPGVKPRPAIPPTEAAAQSIRDRHELARRERDAAQSISAAYPYNDEPVLIKMKDGRTISTSYQLALAAIVRGDAELIVPGKGTVAPHLANLEFR